MSNLTHTEATIVQLHRQQLLNSLGHVARFVPGEAVATLTRNGSGELVIRATNTDGTSGAEITLTGLKLSGADLSLSLTALRSVARYSESDELRLRTANERAVLTGDKSEFRLAITEEEDLPTPPVLAAGGTEVRMTSHVLSGLYSRVRFASCSNRDGCSYATSAIALRAEPLRLVMTATDLFSVATATAPVACTGSADVLLPAAALNRWATGMHTHDEARLRLTPTLAILTCGDVVAWSQPAAGSHPPAEALAFDAPHSIPLPPALRTVLSLVGPGDEVTLSVAPAHVELTTPHGSARVSVLRHRGPALSIPLDGHRLSRAVFTYARIGQPIALGYSHANRPIVLSSGNARYALVPHLLRDEVAA